MPRKGPKAAAVGGNLVGTNGDDTFILKAGDGQEVVSDFDPAHDRVMFDVGHAYSDVLYLGRLSDGLTFSNGYGTATFTVSASDVNHDGVTDTTVLASSGDSITLLSVAPGDLYGWNFFGG